MPISDPTWSKIPENVQATLKRYLVELRKLLGDQIEAVILYGSLPRGEYVEGHSNINLLLMLQTCSLENLQLCGKLNEKWQKHGVVPPLVLNEQELQQSFELFPVEYFEIKENHVLLEGRDPFLALHIDDRNLFQQCQQELNGNLVRVRQRFIEGHGRPEAVRALLTLSLMALLPSLRGISRVLDHPVGGTSLALLKNLSTVLKVDEAVFVEVLEMKQGLRTPGMKALPQLFFRYVQGLTEVIAQVGKSQQQES